MKPKGNTDKYFKEINDELKKGSTQKTHPFSYFTLGTVGLDQFVRLLTEVLMDFSEDIICSF